MKHCQKIKRLFIEAYYRELDDRQMALFEEHLGSCPGCAREFSAVKTTLQNLDNYRRPVQGNDYWESYWTKLSRRLEHEKGKKISFIQWLKNRIPEISWPHPLYLRPALSGIALLLVGIIIGRTLFVGTGEPQQQPETTMSLPGKHDRLVQARAEQYIGRAKLILLGIVNYDSQSESPLRPALARQIQISRSLVNESSALKEELVSSRDYRLSELISELELVLLQIANLDDNYDFVDVELIRSGAEKKALLFKIDIGEGLISRDKSLFPVKSGGRETDIRKKGENIL